MYCLRYVLKPGRSVSHVRPPIRDTSTVQKQKEKNKKEVCIFIIAQIYMANIC